MKRFFSLALVIVMLAVLVPVAGAAPLAQGEEYIVRAGDWLSKLADKYLGDTMAYPAIVLATNMKSAEDATFAYIDNPDLIEPGWKLWIPGAEEAAELMAAPEGTTYKIGFASSVTGGGSFLGAPERNVAEIVKAQIEATGGVVGSDGVLHPVEIIIGDTESKPDVAVSLTRRYIDEDQVVALVMGSLTPISLAIASVATEAEVPYVSMASSSTIIQDPADPTKMLYWVFKTPQSNGDVAVWQVKRLQKMGATSVCYLYENTGYGKDCFNSSMMALEAAGFTTASSDSFERTDTEFPQVSGVQAAGCDVVVVGAIPPGASMVTIALRQALPDIPIIHGHGVCTDDFITTGGAAVEGVELPCSPVIIAEDVPSDDPQKAVFMYFKKLYTDYTGEPVSTFGGHGWDGLMWVLDALKTLPDGLTLEEQRAAVRDYLETKIVNWPGTAGVFTLSPTDHYGLTEASFTWFKVEGGKWVPFPEEQW
jgi:branched-chain amino acid transport system substrate-binding protein